MMDTRENILRDWKRASWGARREIKNLRSLTKNEEYRHKADENRFEKSVRQSREHRGSFPFEWEPGPGQEARETRVEGREEGRARRQAIGAKVGEDGEAIEQSHENPRQRVRAGQWDAPESAGGAGERGDGLAES